MCGSVFCGCACLTLAVFVVLLLCVQRVLNCNGSSAMLRQYKTEWQLFFEQSYYLPMPFKTLTASLHHSATGQFLPSTVDKNSGNLIGQVSVCVTCVVYASVFVLSMFISLTKP